MRSYDDPCGLARALDLVGERWALLVVRELVLGPKRFSDLRRGLPGLSQNVLAQRLRELEEAGVVTRRRLEPPASTWAYELTERGRALEPALLALAAWGSRTPMSSGAAAAELSADALMLALRTTAQPAGEPARVELRLDDDRFGVLIGEPGGEQVSVTRGSLARPDAVISGSAAAFRAVVFGGAPLSDLDVFGDRAIAERFVRMFPRPAVSRPRS
jgi:DNA-binding HxlR family transcriptional regulator